MFRRLLLAAVMAGLLAGLFISAVQEFTTTPIILHAEEYEKDGAGSPGNLLERAAYTAIGNIVLAIGFALILMACFAVRGGEIDGRRGVIWGLAGYAVFSLAPALGLPPDAPGGMAAELAARQEWWFMAAGATALGLALMAFGRGIPWIILGIVILAAPHFIGAPQPEASGGNLPPDIAAHFAAASLVTSAMFWAVLGWLSGTFHRRAGINP